MKPDMAVLKDRLYREEGYRRIPYLDSLGVETIGIGRNLRDEGISLQEAYMLLDNDLDSHWDQLVKSLPWVDSLDPVRQRVLLDMCFNLGIESLLKFKNMLSLIESSQYKDAAQHMRESLWAKQVGKRAVNLADIMESGHES